ncbi:hypothetical protein RFI_22869 [Reticulomyxa filosa]|uniref:40S ribosomal protein S7 n=1 Tax=Reticulomyxa filosa TaxID=46433 RepID=X6MKY8_RETFI|nr:hypothetical protein RFI_22869 [Reticulomyxa filosa]|eukprot:ETO14509.1 hypothetical protein RFI_22869 [Reticulomyxa filosa]
MYGCFDDENPLEESMELMESILVQFIHKMTCQAQELANMNKRNVYEGDLMFLIRKDRKKFQRINELLNFHENLKKLRIGKRLTLQMPFLSLHHIIPFVAFKKISLHNLDKKQSVFYYIFFNRVYSVSVICFEKYPAKLSKLFLEWVLQENLKQYKQFWCFSHKFCWTSNAGGKKKKQGQGKAQPDKAQQPKKEQPKQEQPKKQPQPKKTASKPEQKKPNPKQNQKKQQKKARREKVSDKASGQKQKKSSASAQKLAKDRLQVIIRSKYQNPTASSKPTILESKICEYLVDLEASDKDLKVIFFFSLPSPNTTQKKKKLHTRVFIQVKPLLAFFFLKSVCFFCVRVLWGICAGANIKKKLLLRDLGIVAVREQTITATKKAIIIFVPFRQLSRWQKIQSRVAVELEKKFSGQDVLFLAQRKVMKLHDIKNNYPRPRNQTITSVHESILNDLVYPTKITGKRLRFRVGGKRILKVYVSFFICSLYLDPKNSKEIEPKLQTYEVVYKKLTKKLVNFVFPRFECVKNSFTFLKVFKRLQLLHFILLNIKKAKSLLFFINVANLFFKIFAQQTSIIHYTNEIFV